LPERIITGVKGSPFLVELVRERENILHAIGVGPFGILVRCVDIHQSREVGNERHLSSGVDAPDVVAPIVSLDTISVVGDDGISREQSNETQ